MPKCTLTTALPHPSARRGRSLAFGHRENPGRSIIYVRRMRLPNSPSYSTFSHDLKRTYPSRSRQNALNRSLLGFRSVPPRKNSHTHSEAAPCSNKEAPSRSKAGSSIYNREITHQEVADEEQELCSLFLSLSISLHVDHLFAFRDIEATSTRQLRSGTHCIDVATGHAHSEGDHVLR